jgi:MFS family permease
MIRDPQGALPAPGAGARLLYGARAFRHRNYRLFFTGQLVSLVGTWMQQVAQSWLVLQLTHDPFVLGAVAALAFLPVLVLGLFGGLIADSLPKRQTLIVTQAIQMSLAFILFGLVVSDLVQVWQIMILALLLGVTNSVDMPTRQAFTVEMVGRDDVPNAIALNSAIFNGARILGPAIAGLTIGFFGGDVAIAFLINGISFAAVIVAYAVMRPNELHSPPVIARARSAGEVKTQLAEGVRYVRRTDLVLLVVVTVGVASTFGMNFGVMIPALADEVLHTDATGFGFLMTASGIGSLIAALAIAFSGRSRPALVPIGALVLGLALVATSFLQAYGPTLVAMAFVGLGAIGMAATANTTVQLAAPDALRGRVVSVYTTVFVGSTPFGGLLTGWIASTFGVDVSFAFAGAACALVGGASLLWLRRIRSGPLLAPSSLAAPEMVPAAAAVPTQAP